MLFKKNLRGEGGYFINNSNNLLTIYLFFIFIRKELFLDRIFQMEILIDLQVFRSIKPKYFFYQFLWVCWCACVSVCVNFSISLKNNSRNSKISSLHLHYIFVIYMCINIWRFLKTVRRWMILFSFFRNYSHFFTHKSRKIFLFI